MANPTPLDRVTIPSSQSAIVMFQLNSIQSITNGILQRTAIGRAYFAIVFTVVLGVWLARSANAFDDETVWEFQPYDVKTFISFDPTLSVDAAAKEQLIKQIAAQIKINFGATWQHEIASTPSELNRLVLSDLPELSIDQLLGDDLVLVIHKEHPQYSKVRSIAAADRLNEILIPKDLAQSFQMKLNEYQQAVGSKKTTFGESNAAQAREMASEDASSSQADRLPTGGINGDGNSDLGSSESNVLETGDGTEGEDEERAIEIVAQRIIISDLTSDELRQKMLAEEPMAAAVLLPMKLVDVELQETTKYFPVEAPWQWNALLEKYSKFIFVSVLRNPDGQIQIATREIDGPMRMMGQTYETRCPEWPMLARQISMGMTRVFSPVARIEDSTALTANFRVRAGGLIMDYDHPAEFRRGDVLVPIVRRNDRNGKPLNIESYPWTYVAVTGGDRVKMFGTVLSGRRGALEGRRNKKTDRVVMKIDPLGDVTNVNMMIVRSGGVSLPGAAVYKRVPGIKGFDYLGTSDWRGLFAIDLTEPPEIEYDLSDAEIAVLTPEELEEATRPLEVKAPGSTAASEKSADGNSEDDAATVANESVMPPPPPRKPTGKLQLNQPLYYYYVKNGNKVLAKMPIVTGLAPVEKAELLDDRRRLEAEAFLKGIQSKMLDVIAQRRILTTRLEKRMEQKKYTEARETLEDLKSVDSYESMAKSLEIIQRKVLDPQKGELEFKVQSKVDGMFAITRQMMQKYLQDTTVRKYDLELLEIERSQPADSGRVEARSTASPAAKSSSSKDLSDVEDPFDF